MSKERVSDLRGISEKGEIGSASSVQRRKAANAHHNSGGRREQTIIISGKTANKIVGISKTPQ